MKRFVHLHLPRSGLARAALAGVGAALGIGLLGLAADHGHVALLMAPFGATAVLLFAAPAAPLSQPANVVGGHLLSAAIGLASAAILPMGLWTAAAAVGLAVTTMVLLRLVHPPAGATAFIAISAPGWGFLVFPVLAGSLVLVAVATAYHRLAGNTYPLAAGGQPR